MVKTLVSCRVNTVFITFTVTARFSRVTRQQLCVSTSLETTTELIGLAGCDCALDDIVFYTIDHRLNTSVSGIGVS